jgi:hypothetical protein
MRPDVDFPAGVISSFDAPNVQRLIAYEPKALKWFPFTPRPVREFRGKNLLNINDNKDFWTENAERIGLVLKTTTLCRTLYIHGLAGGSEAPPSYEASCSTPTDRKNGMVKEKYQIKPPC